MEKYTWKLHKIYFRVFQYNTTTGLSDAIAELNFKLNSQLH